MGEHYTRNTLEATSWCAKCQRMTQHRVDSPPEGHKGAGRLGPCIDPSHLVRELTKKQEQRRREQERDRVQRRLFQ